MAVKVDPAVTTARALEIIEQLIALYPSDRELKLKALQLYDQVQLIPMSQVLERVPGATIKDKMASIGVTRQCWYLWQRGATRPNAQQANRLAKLTGIKACRIRPRDHIDRPRRKSSR